MLTACLDEAMHFKDALEVLILNGEPLNVALSAEGFGSAVHCPELESSGHLDLGSLYLGSTMQKEIVFINEGRKAATLKWHCLDRQRTTKPSKKQEQEINQVTQQSVWKAAAFELRSAGFYV